VRLARYDAEESRGLVCRPDFSLVGSRCQLGRGRMGVARELSSGIVSLIEISATLD
jgi:hypothetical protein